MRWPWQPKNTFRSGLLQIIEGLENGSVVLPQTKESAPTPKLAAPADLVRTFSLFLDTLDVSIRKMRAREVETSLIALGMFLAGAGVVIGGVVWASLPFIILGTISCAGSIGPIGLVRRVRYHRIRGELLVEVLRATPDAERPWQFLRLYTQLKTDLEMAGVEVNPLLQQAKRVFDGWRVTPPTTSLST